jgi:uncharacterized lipoprotein
MKLHDPTKGIAPVFCALILACLALIFCAGCDTIKTTYQAATTGFSLSASAQTGVVNDDVIVVNTEKALAIALDTFDVFLKLEYDNRAALSKLPQVHAFAENVRRNGKNWIVSARNAKDAYKHNRSALNHANLVTAYKTLKAGIEESRKYINAHSGV